MPGVHDGHPRVDPDLPPTPEPRGWAPAPRWRCRGSTGNEPAVPSPAGQPAGQHGSGAPRRRSPSHGCRRWPKESGHAVRRPGAVRGDVRPFRDLPAQTGQAFREETAQASFLTHILQNTADPLAGQLRPGIKDPGMTSRLPGRPLDTPPGRTGGNAPPGARRVLVAVSDRARRCRETFAPRVWVRQGRPPKSRIGLPRLGKAGGRHQASGLPWTPFFRPWAMTPRYLVMVDAFFLVGDLA